MCANSYDYYYPAYGGRCPRAQMVCGRVGSVFNNAGVCREEGLVDAASATIGDDAIDASDGETTPDRGIGSERPPQPDFEERSPGAPRRLLPEDLEPAAPLLNDATPSDFEALYDLHAPQMSVYAAEGGESVARSGYADSSDPY
jgi:hypothetical protein